MKYVTELMKSFNEPKRECLLNGNKIHYDVCSDDSLEVAKKSYPHFDYIVSGKIYFINGYKNISKNIIHFFIRKEIKMSEPLPPFKNVIDSLKKY